MVLIGSSPKGYGLHELLWEREQWQVATNEEQPSDVPSAREMLCGDLISQCRSQPPTDDYRADSILSVEAVEREPHS